MHKRKFVTILSCQHDSRLSVREFCRNESYPVSTFYYWKHKFGLSESDDKHDAAVNGRDVLAPISVLEQGRDMPHSGVDKVGSNEIEFVFPEDIRIYFRGCGQSQSVLELITPIYHRHVLPQ